jgi:hypothetical protein
MSMVGAALVLSGCLTSTTGRLLTDDTVAVPRPTTAAALVTLFPTLEIGRAYEIVGVVVAASSTGEQPDRTASLLKAEAAALGADAVVDVRMEMDLGYWTNAVKLSGVAVRLK